MDKKFLIRLNDSFKRIKTILLLNENIRKWLVYDNMESGVPSIEQAAEHIFLQPVIEVETTEPFNKKNYITLTVPEGEYQKNTVGYVVRIIIMCDKTSWNLNGDIRPLLIAQEVINELHNLKLDCANPVEFSSITETVTSKNTYGYSVLFSMYDGISDIDEK